MPDNHDKRYKKLFSNKLLVKELLESFVHEDFVARLDFSRMEQVNKSFITRRHRRQEADMIWKIPLDNEPVYLFLLLEFQSTVDRFLSLRMLRYITEFYDYLIKDERIRILPPVFPLLVYNGDAPWTAPEELGELIRPRIATEYLPGFRYYPVVERDIPDDALLSLRNAVASIFYLEKSASGDVGARLKTLVRLLQESPHPVIRSVKAFLNDYLKELENFEENCAILEETICEEGGPMFSTALKGYVEIQRNEGKAEGILLDKQENLIRLMARKFGSGEAVQTRINACTDRDKLTAALDLILDASSPEEVLEKLG